MHHHKIFIILLKMNINSFKLNNCKFTSNEKNTNIINNKINLNKIILNVCFLFSFNFFSKFKIISHSKKLKIRNIYFN